MGMLLLEMFGSILGFCPINHESYFDKIMGRFKDIVNNLSSHVATGISDQHFTTPISYKLHSFETTIFSRFSLARIEDEIRRQIGVKFPQDD